MKFRKKPIVIEAIQYTGNNNEEIVKFAGHKVQFGSANDTELRIYTLEGDMTVKVNDWIIKGIKGEFYPCKPDIFKETYEGDKMKIINITCVEKLQSLLDKSCSQTIRPAWNNSFTKDAISFVRAPTVLASKLNPLVIEKPPKFKVKEKVKLMWNQRSKYDWFCRDCGEGIDGYITKYRGTNVFRHNGLHDCFKKNQHPDFLDLIFSDNSVFNKLLGTAEINEILKINMGKDIVNRNYQSLSHTGQWISCKIPQANYENWLKDLALRDGFKGNTRVTKMFKVIDNFYDLKSIKPFYPYRWLWQ